MESKVQSISVNINITNLNELNNIISETSKRLKELSEFKLEIGVSANKESDKKEKTWHCIAWHLGNFLDDAKAERKSDFAKACETCKYNNHCDFDISPCIKLLENKTGVKFSFNTDLKMTDVNPSND